MRDVACRVLTELGLDYSITLVAGGESGNFEIVMWDRPRDSYFTLKFRCHQSSTMDDLAALIRGRLQERLTSTTPGGDRRPARPWSAA